MGSMHLGALWRHPVKSMAGEQTARADIGPAGMAMDRRLALRDTETGLIASAKSPRLWGALLHCSATADEETGRIRIVLPDGAVLHADDADVDERLSAALGRAIELCATAPDDAAIARLWPDVPGLAPPEATPTAPATVTVGDLAAGAPAGTFFDFAPLHVVTEATLAALGELLDDTDDGRVDPRRFRANLVLAGDLAPFAENTWTGAEIAVGEVVLRIITPSPRCIVPSLPQPGISSDIDLLRAIARHNRVDVLDRGRYGCVGAYAEVVRAGPVAVGDAVHIEDAR